MNLIDLRLLIAAPLILSISACSTVKGWMEEEPEPEPEPLPAFEWAPDEQRAASRLSSRLPSMVLNVRVEPHWIAGSDSFWYRRQHDAGVEFVRVDPAKQQRELAFDHVAMANALSEALDRPFDPNELPLRELIYSDPAATPAVRIAQGVFQCDLKALNCAKLDAEPLPPIVAEDGALFWQTAGGSKEILAAPDKDGGQWALLPDSAGDEIVRRRSGVRLRPAVLWAPDNKRLLTQRINQQHVALMPIFQASADDGSARPVVHQLHVPLPGEKAATAELFVFDADNGKRVKLQTGELEVPLGGPIARGHMWWSESGDKIYWVNTTKDGVRLSSFDARTGKRTEVINEAGSIASWPAPDATQSPIVRFLKNGDVIWYSTASGYGHLYYHKARGGGAPVAITRGDWDVQKLVYVDEATKVVFFTGGVPAEASEDGVSGFANLYRVNFDGTDMRRLTQENATHTLSASPAANFFVDTYSRADWPSKSVVRDRFGRVVMSLEEGKTENLIVDGFVMPEVFRLVPAEGGKPVTGTLYRPSNFDPARRWAVIDLMPPAAGSPMGDATFYASRYEAQALAEAGFIVIAIDRGAPAITDHIATIKRLQGIRPWMDLERVGVFGAGEGGAMAARALAQHPDFYHVGVAVSGSHDADLLFGAEAGDPAGGLEAEAGAVKGRLFLAHGELDDTVHVSHTLRLVDALIKADKKFDMLIVPNVGHNLIELPWLQKRTWEYFWRYLGGPRLLGETLKISADQQVPSYHLETEITPSKAREEDITVPDTVDDTIDKLRQAEEDFE